ncbi:MAG: hypothetical protein NZM39_09140 [Bernardetiaceae bacterium]|nr:hypothetical protein [Bernardetiaceae bacterium]
MKIILVAQPNVAQPQANSSFRFMAESRGLTLKDSFISPSGFCLFTGEREVQGLKIEEGIAQGVGITYLCSLRIIESSSGIIISEKCFKDVTYNRDKVRKLVKEELVKQIQSGLSRNGYSYEEKKIHDLVDSLLNKAYYQQSDKALLRVVKGWGLI